MSVEQIRPCPMQILVLVNAQGRLIVACYKTHLFVPKSNYTICCYEYAQRHPYYNILTAPDAALKTMLISGVDGFGID